MATSRTGTARWKRTVRIVRHRDRHITHCPCDGNCKHHHGRTCGAPLDWENSRRPNSPEPDHIVPPNQGGTDHPDNARTICRRCNQSLGDKRGNKRTTKPLPSLKPDTADDW